MYSISCFSQTYIAGGEVSGRWEKKSSPYIITDNITIKENEQLIIEAGVIIKSDPKCEIAVWGSLVANGEKNDSILFTENQNERWGGIRFYNDDKEQDSSLLKFCTIEFSENYLGGGISIKAPNVTVSHCVIHNNIAWEGAGIYTNTCVNVVNTKIIHNEARNNVGGVYAEGNAKFLGCVIAFNKAPNNFAFIAFDFPVFKNCNICYNSKGGDYNRLETLYSFSGNYKLHNCIVYYNSPLHYNAVVTGINEFPEFKYCNIQGGLKSIKSSDVGISGYFNGVYENCIDVEPGFINSQKGDFQLYNSYCIDAGDPNSDTSDLSEDILGNNRIFNSENSRIDIGAYEYSKPTPNRIPYIIPKDTIHILKNTIQTIEFPFYDGDIKDEYFVNLQSDNDNLDVFVTCVNDSSFSISLNPKDGWKGEARLIKKISNNQDESLNYYQDTSVVIADNCIEGIIKDHRIINDTVRVIGDIIIEKSGKLSIEEGTYIEFQDSYQISVLGSIEALGTKENRIEFNAVDTLDIYIDGRRYEQGWSGIRFYNSKINTSIFRYCNFKNIGVPSYINKDNYPTDYSPRYNAISIVNYDDVSFNNCFFGSNFNPNTKTDYVLYKYQSSSSNLIIVSSKNIILNGCIFVNSFINESGATCVDADYSSIQISNCRFKDIKSEIHGNSFANSYCILSTKSNINVKHCDFINNNVGRAVVASYNDETMTIENCNFFNNKSKVMELFSDGAMVRNNKFVNNGMAINSRCDINIIGNLISNSEVYCGCSNFFGTAINLGVGNSLIANNTIVNNKQDSYGKAIYYSYCSPTIVNNVFYNNANISSDSEAHIGGYNGAGGNIKEPVISHNFISGNPLFTLKDTLDYSLKSASTCINMANIDYVMDVLPANDLKGNNRIDKTTGLLDQGAYEYLKEIESLKVIHIEPVSSEKNINIDTPLLITFNAPIKILDADLINLSCNNEFKTLQLSEDKTVLIITSYEPWFFNSQLELTIDKGAVAYIEDESFTNSNFETMFSVRPCEKASLEIESSSDLYCPNLEAILKATSTGDSKLDYQWYYNNELILSPDSSKVDLAEVTKINEGIYICEVTDLCGNIITDSIYVSIYNDIVYPNIEHKWGGVYFISNEQKEHSNYRWFLQNEEILTDIPVTHIPKGYKGSLYVSVRDSRNGCILNSDTIMVEENKRNEPFIAYPNPINTNETLELVFNSDFNDGKIIIYSLNGGKVEELKFNKSNIFNHRFTNYEPGIYLIKVQLDSNNYSFKLFIN
ncbi:T9SS type A sorting domain-containing protein [Plebeiibacterium sediminum]|uniref:T9SS type A sorting domain-containing protein n=1 Tax=Plebeiibacterium sediminum TaxID=2992112 RepID=A0AAE3M986_9BACT|nr:T9SS type A sorting domain-containing protein [Plebeiobacterium sediminum]MCW3789596.1 T9SS type A sorting domain-containing protein [Plebeiobacterium sediminum]